MRLLTKENHTRIPAGTNIMNQSRYCISGYRAFGFVITIHISCKATTTINTFCMCTTVVIQDKLSDFLLVSNSGKQISRVHPVCFTNRGRIVNTVAPNSTHDFRSHKSCAAGSRIACFFSDDSFVPKGIETQHRYHQGELQQSCSCLTQ